MTKEWGAVGGRSDVILADDHGDLGMWRINELPLLEADEIGGRDEFPIHGDFAVATEIDTGREVYVRIYEGLRDEIDQELEDLDDGLLNVGISVEETERGDGKTDPWRFTVTVSPLGPPDGAGP